MTFSIFLLVALLVCGAISLWYRWTASPAASSDSIQFTHRSNKSENLPILVDYARSLWPVLLFVLVLRSFVLEPFRIPSGSMLPNLYNGDFLVVNKFSYGLRLPIINKKIIDIGDPKRGDVMVFRYPVEPNINFIKRVIGLPGDTLSYRDKTLLINGIAAQETADGYFRSLQLKTITNTAEQYIERIETAEHKIVLNPNRPSRTMAEITVPPGHYFVMGDNRDHSNDSREWGFVPENHIIGKAFFIWFSWKSVSGGGVNWSRVGTVID